MRHIDAVLLASPPRGRSAAVLLRGREMVRPDVDAERGLASREAEHAVVGSLLIDPDAMANVLETGLVASDFHYSVPQIIFATMLEIHSNGGPPADYVVLCEKLRQTGRLDDIGGQDKVTRLIGECATSVHAGHYAGLVRDLARRRRYVRVASDLIRLTHDGQSIDALDVGAAELWAEISREAKPEPQIRSAAEILASEQPIAPDIVAGFLPGDEVTVLAGHGGTGKGYVCLDLATRITQGLPWLGLATTRATVLIVDRENSEPRTRHRLARIMAGHGLEIAPELYVVDDTRTRLTDAAFVGEIAGRARYVGAGLVILDSLADFLGDLDENSNPDMALVADRLRAITRETGAAVLAQHHTSKASAGKDWQTARGASSLFDGVHCVIQMTRDGDTVTLRQEKNRDGPELTVKARVNWADGPPESFCLSPLSLTVGRQPRKGDPDERAILDILKDGDPRLSSELVAAVMKETGRTRRTVQGKLRGLIDDRVLNAPDRAPGKAYTVSMMGK